MITGDLRERMRRAYHIEHKSIRQIAHEEGTYETSFLRIAI